MNYIKHLIECQCTLHIFKNKTTPIYHKFAVFSNLDKNDNVIPKYVMCDNCDIVHYVNEISKSEIKWGKESLKSLIVTKDDIKFNLSSLGFDNIVDILERNNLPLADWESAFYFIDNKLNATLVFNKQELDDNIVISFIEFQEGKISIKKEILQRYL